MKFITFDPGHTTGWAIFENGKALAAGESEGWYQVVELIETHNVDMVLLESFRLYPWKAKHKSWDSFLEVEVIGVIKHFCWYNGIKVVEQIPAQKDFFDNKKLKKLGYDRLSASRHAKDALRHGLVYYCFGEGKDEYAQTIFRGLQ